MTDHAAKPASAIVHRPTSVALRPDLHIIADFIPEAAKVLDLGCGDGELLEFLVRQKGIKGRGIEISEAGMLSCVRRGLSVRQGNLQEGLADYPDRSFDFTVLSQTLHFLDDPEMILGEMLRVGHKAIVSFPELGLLALPVGITDYGPDAAGPRSTSKLASEAALAGLHYHRFRAVLPGGRHLYHAPGLPGPQSPDADPQIHQSFLDHRDLRLGARPGGWVRI